MPDGADIPASGALGMVLPYSANEAKFRIQQTQTGDGRELRLLAWTSTPGLIASASSDTCCLQTNADAVNGIVDIATDYKLQRSRGHGCWTIV